MEQAKSDKDLPGILVVVKNGTIRILLVRSLTYKTNSITYKARLFIPFQ